MNYNNYQKRNLKSTEKKDNINQECIQEKFYSVALESNMVGQIFSLQQKINTNSNTKQRKEQLTWTTKDVKGKGGELALAPSENARAML